MAMKIKNIKNHIKMSLNFIDIGFNITDEMYQGVYHNKKHHECDLNIVFERAKLLGVDKLVATGTTIEGILLFS